MKSCIILSPIGGITAKPVSARRDNRTCEHCYYDNAHINLYIIVGVVWCGTACCDWIKRSKSMSYSNYCTPSGSDPYIIV